MMWLSLLVSVAFMPGITGASIPTGWAAMSFTLPWVMLKDVKMTPFHYLGLAFLAYTTASLAWTNSPLDGIGELWHWALLALAFMLGSRLELLGPFWKGLALGCGVSSVVAVAQWFGWDGVANLDWAKWAGLFYNNAVAGAVAAVTLGGCLTYRLWRYVALPIPLLLLSQSRGAWAALFCTWAICIYRSFGGVEKIIFSLVIAIALGFGIYLFHGASDSIRLTIWGELLHRLSFFGAGIGSSANIYFFTPSQLFHIEHAHNDYLNLLYEYGVGALPLFLLAALLVEQTNAYAWPAYICSLILACYYWPLESPVSAFILAVVAGHLAGGSRVAWRDLDPCRRHILPYLRPHPSTASREHLSI